MRKKLKWFLLAIGIVLLLVGCSEDTKLSGDEADSHVAEAGGVQNSQENSRETFLENYSQYAYNTLSLDEQIWYREMAESFGRRQEDGVLLSKECMKNGLGEKDIDRLFQCVMIDHPELFYVKGYTYSLYRGRGGVSGLRVIGKYEYSLKEIKERKKKMEQEVKALIEGAGRMYDDYSKVCYVYETIIRNTSYNLEAPDNQNMYSVFVNRESVCNGYAKAVQYLLNRMGVECTIVHGDVYTGEKHAWNFVKVNGSYYYLDATWGDPSYQVDGETVSGKELPEINYDYLCVDSSQIQKTHRLDSVISFPVCEEIRDNYYVREGAYFSEFDEVKMKLLFDKAHALGKKSVTVKAASRECYNQIVEALIQQNGVFQYLWNDSGSIVYAQNEKLLSITFWVTND